MRNSEHSPRTWYSPAHIEGRKVAGDVVAVLTRDETYIGTDSNEQCRNRIKEFARLSGILWETKLDCGHIIPKALGNTIIILTTKTQVFSYYSLKSKKSFGC